MGRSNIFIRAGLPPTPTSLFFCLRLSSPSSTVPSHHYAIDPTICPRFQPLLLCVWTVPPMQSHSSVNYPRPCLRSTITMILFLLLSKSNINWTISTNNSKSISSSSDCSCIHKNSAASSTSGSRISTHCTLSRRSMWPNNVWIW